MRHNFLISAGVALILPILLISFFAGPSVLISFLRWFLFILLLVMIPLYFLGSSGKTAISKVSNFESGLWFTSICLKLISVINIISCLVIGIILYLVLGGYLLFDIEKIRDFVMLVVSFAIIMILLAIVALIANSQLQKQSRLGYFLTLFVSVFYVVFLVGLYPLWFLTRFRSLYFTKIHPI